MMSSVVWRVAGKLCSGIVFTVMSPRRAALFLIHNDKSHKLGVDSKNLLHRLNWLFLKTQWHTGHNSSVCLDLLCHRFKVNLVSVTTWCYCVKFALQYRYVGEALFH